MDKLNVEHLHVECIKSAEKILNDLREVAESVERSGVYGDMASRFRTACSTIGAILEHDISPEKVLSRPMPWTEKVIRKIPIISKQPAK